jgi:hypothetical protein
MEAIWPMLCLRSHAYGIYGFDYLQGSVPRLEMPHISHDTKYFDLTKYIIWHKIHIFTA